MKIAGKGFVFLVTFFIVSAGVITVGATGSDFPGLRGLINEIETCTESTPLKSSLSIIDAKEFAVVQEFMEPLSDPDIDNEPYVNILGTSGEFTSQHYPSVAPDYVSYVALQWTHTADTVLDWGPLVADDHVECNEFIYFADSFDWQYDLVPDNVNITLQYAIDLTDDFQTIPEGGLMFAVYVWLVDSSGNWETVYRSSPPYSDSFGEVEIALDNSNISAGFGGMVQVGGMQEDPFDSLTIAVGLTPTDEFRVYDSTEPWRIYNGSVTARFDSLSMEIHFPSQTDYTPIISIGALFVVVMAVAIVWRRKSKAPAPTFLPTLPLDEPKVPSVEEPEAVLPSVPVVEEEELAGGVQALRGCAAVGGKFEYKVKITNNTEFVITNVTVTIVAFPDDCMDFSEDRMKTIGRIEPDAFRSPQFVFTPTKDCVEGHIVATVSYMDHKNSLVNIEVEPYVIRSVCDLLEPLESSLEEFEAMLFDMVTNSEEIEIDGCPDAAFSKVLEFLPERNFELISTESKTAEGKFQGVVRGLAEGKYTRKKVAVRIVVSGQPADENASVLVEALGDDPDMLPTTIDEMIDGLKGVPA